MNGVESLLLIIVGILAIKIFYFPVEKDFDLSQGTGDRIIFLLVTAYAWITFIAGNVMFVYWLFTK